MEVDQGVQLRAVAGCNRRPPQRRVGDGLLNRHGKHASRVPIPTNPGAAARMAWEVRGHRAPARERRRPAGRVAHPPVLRVPSSSQLPSACVAAGIGLPPKNCKGTRCRCWALLCQSLGFLRMLRCLLPLQHGGLGLRQAWADRHAAYGLLGMTPSLCLPCHSRHEPDPGRVSSVLAAAAAVDAAAAAAAQVATFAFQVPPCTPLRPCRSGQQGVRILRTYGLLARLATPSCPRL